MSFFDRLKRLLGSLEASSTQAGGNGETTEACKPISCMDAITKLQEYLDGELDHASHEEVAHHFEICQKCYPHLRLEERFKDLLQRSQVGEVCPGHVRVQVLELLSAEVEKSG